MIDSGRPFLALQNLGSEVQMVIWGSSTASGEMEMPKKMEMLYSIGAEPPAGAWVAPRHPKQQV